MRSALSNPLRDAWVEINLDLFEENLREIKKHIKSKRILAVVKADGYGHGSLMLAGDCLIIHRNAGAYQFKYFFMTACIPNDILK